MTFAGGVTGVTGVVGMSGVEGPSEPPQAERVWANERARKREKREKMERWVIGKGVAKLLQSSSVQNERKGKPDGSGDGADEAAGGRHKAGHYTVTGGELLHFEPSPGWGRVLCALSAQRGWGYLMKHASMTLRSLPSEGLMVCLPLMSMQLEPPPSRLSASVQPAALSSWPTCAVVMPAMPSVI